MALDLAPKLEIADPDGTRTEVVLGESTTIGRQAGNDIVLDDQRISRQHAVIVCQAGACHITDLGSSNGTYVAGERVPANVPMPIAPGVEITLGSFTLSLRDVAQSSRLHPGAELLPQVEPEPALEPTPPDGPPLPASEQPVLLGADEGAAAQITREPDEEPLASPPPDAIGTIALHHPDDDLTSLESALTSGRLLNYLPGIYHTEFMSRFLGIFEATLTPIEWTIDNFDLFLDPGTAPSGFLVWLAGWFDLALDPSWSDAQRRQLLREAHAIYARRGTRWSLGRVLEIYTGQAPQIDDTGAALEPFTFRVTLPHRAEQVGRELIERLIDAHKPAHTSYLLEFE